MDIRVLRAYKVFSNGKHNAFTTSAHFAGADFLAFRSGASHVSMDGEIVLLRRKNDKCWEKVCCFAQQGLDLRDPHLIVFYGKLHLYFFSRRKNGEKVETRSLITTSDDGVSFTEIKQLDGGQILWGFAAHNGKLYASSYERNQNSGVYEPTLLVSKNGQNFKRFFKFPFPGSEAAIDFDDEGVLWALVRESTGGDGAVPSICRISPPFDKISEEGNNGFQRIAGLPVPLHGPMLKIISGNFLICGRTWEANRTHLRTDLFMWSREKGLEYISTLPSGGDTSYASWLDVAPGKAMLSYYSAHEHKMALSFEEEKVPNHPSAEHCAAADIFIADICWQEEESLKQQNSYL